MEKEDLKEAKIEILRYLNYNCDENGMYVGHNIHETIASMLNARPSSGVHFGKSYVSACVTAQKSLEDLEFVLGFLNALSVLASE